MSIAAMTAVWKDAPVSGSELLLLLAIADMANDDYECWPSIKHLAQKVRVTERQVKRLLDKLVLNELIEKKMHNGKGKYKGWETNLYVVTPDKWPITIELMASDAGDTSDARVTPSHDARVMTSGDTRDTLNHKGEPKKETKDSEAIKVFIKAWLDGQLAKPATNQYENKTNRSIAKALSETPITPIQVTDYTKVLALQPYWRGKLVPFKNVGDNIAAWLALQPTQTPPPASAAPPPRERETPLTADEAAARVAEYERLMAEIADAIVEKTVAA